MSVQSITTIAPLFVAVKQDDRLLSESPVTCVQWYWGFDMLTGEKMWFWVGLEIAPRDMPNYLGDEPGEALDTRQGVSYNLDRGF